MTHLDALWHLLNLFGPALGVGFIASGAAKLLWRRELSGVGWGRLGLWACGACALVTLGGLVVLGRDGRMATYGAMIVVCAATLYAVGFTALGRRRR
jgi:hypothetical protein